MEAACHAPPSAVARSAATAYRSRAQGCRPRGKSRHHQDPPEGVPVTPQSFTCHREKEKLKQAELRDRHYLLRSNLVAEDPQVRWERYTQLTPIEAAFRTMKSELGIRPIYHQLEHRVEAHILVAFLAYCLIVTLKNRLQALAPYLTPKAVLKKLGAIQMLDVWLPATEGRWLG